MSAADIGRASLDSGLLKHNSDGQHVYVDLLSMRHEETDQNTAVEPLYGVTADLEAIVADDERDGTNVASAALSSHGNNAMGGSTSSAQWHGKPASRPTSEATGAEAELKSSSAEELAARRQAGDGPDGSCSTPVSGLLASPGGLGGRLFSRSDSGTVMSQRASVDSAVVQLNGSQDNLSGNESPEQATREKAKNTASDAASATAQAIGSRENPETGSNRGPSACGESLGGGTQVTVTASTASSTSAIKLSHAAAGRATASRDIPLPSVREDGTLVENFSQPAMANKFGTASHMMPRKHRVSSRGGWRGACSKAQLVLGKEDWSKHERT